MRGAGLLTFFFGAGFFFAGAGLFFATAFLTARTFLRATGFLVRFAVDF